MSRHKKLLFIPAIILIAALLPVSATFADTTAADCADGQWEVRPNQTLYFIAFTCGVTVDALVAYNNIENPNLIFTGQVLIIPPSDFTPTQPPPADPAAPPPPQPPVGGSGSGVAVSIAPPLYSGDGRVATVNITVTNLNVTPMLAGGRYYPNAGVDNPDGPQWVTLLGAIHAENPYPEVINEPLWHATVYTSDGHVFPAYAGCIYEESIFAMGDEPLSRADDIWFHWEVTLDGGWFDCGNAYQVKPEDMLPGQGGSAPLTVYFIHPRLWNTVPTVNVRINRIDLELFDTTGRSLGTVASQTFP